jgi:DNA processing protein
LIDTCGSAGGALEAPFAFLSTVPGINKQIATAIQSARPAAARQVLDDLSRFGGELLLPGDPAFPKLLDPVDPAPMALFALGRVELLSRPAVAIVGSRDHTRYGAEVCDAVAEGAAVAGLVVVSGMARGLDAVAHRGALNVEGGTIGVLGNGLGVIYPAANRELYSAVGRQGLLLTECPPGERPQAGAFPRRNRLIAGLARVTVVIEAAVGSGALITANEALELGRDVMAVPGPVTSPTSVGANQLLRDGAIALLELEDLLLRYPEVRRGNGGPRIPEPDPQSSQGKVLALLKGGPRQADELAATLRLPTGQVLAVLGSMEIQGMVIQRPGMMYCLPKAKFAAAKEGI